LRASPGTRTAPLPSRAHPISNRDRLHGGLVFHERKVRDSNPGAPHWRIHGFRPCPSCPGHLPRAESGRLERHAWQRALVSSEAQDPAWFTLPGTVPGIRTRNLCGLSAAPLPVGLERPGADGWSRTGDLHLGQVTRCQLRHIRMEPARGIEPRPPPLPESGALPTELHPGAPGSRDSNPVGLVPDQVR
jgi:hypothetical protein